MNIQSQPRFDKSTFFSWVAHQERRFELVGGKAMMLPYVKRNHQKISSNLLLALGSKLDLSKFNVAGGDFAIETGEDSVRFADIMVEPAGGPGDGMTAVDAAVQSKLLGAENVTIVYRRGQDKMSASGYEQDHAASAGVRIVTHAAPVAVHDGAVEFAYTEEGPKGLIVTAQTFTLKADQVV